MARTKERRAKKKAKRNGELIPGVPSFHPGGTIAPYTAATHRFNFPNESQHVGGGSPTGDGPGPSGTGDTIRLMANGRYGIFDSQGQFIRELSAPTPGPGGGGGGGGSATPQFRPGELALLQARDDREQAQLELDRLIAERDNAIAKGDLQLRRDIETRIAKAQERQFQLDQFIQQQQLMLDAQLGSAEGLAGIGSSLGNIELQRAQFLSNLAANPRDSVQQSVALGGGTSFIDFLEQGQRPPGQGINRAQENLPLGQAFIDLINAVTARPDLPFFNEAAEGFRDIQPITPQTFAHGGQMVTDEPIVGIGLKSQKARFTLGEPTREFPEGAPEQLNITPLSGRQGNTAGAGGARNALLAGGVRGINPQPTGGVLDPGATTAAPFVQPAADPDQKLQNTVDAFGQGSFISDILRASQQPGLTPPPVPLTPGQQVAQFMSALQPIDFFSMLPSDRALLESRISALGFDPATIFAEFLRSLPTGANPNAISFGNFSGGGSVATTRVA